MSGLVPKYCRFSGPSISDANGLFNANDFVLWLCFTLVGTNHLSRKMYDFLSFLNINVCLSEFFSFFYSSGCKAMLAVYRKRCESSLRLCFYHGTSTTSKLNNNSSSGKTHAFGS